MGFFFFCLSLEHGWSYKIDQKWLLMTPVFTQTKKKIKYPKTHSWLSLLIVHFNEGWIIQDALVDIIAQRIDAVDVFMEARPSACCVFFGDKEDFREKGQSAYMPVCVVVCRINRQQLWFILYSQCRGPLYLTGKVKAYSLEAVPQRSTCSLGMRNRTIERKTVKICTPLLSSACVLPLTSWKRTLHTLQQKKAPAVSIL